MTPRHLSSRPRRPVARMLATVLAAAAALSSVRPTESALAASPGADARTSTFTVVVTPSDVTLCPGQSDQVAVRVSRQVTRTVRGQAVVGNPSDVRRARIRPSGGDPSIASVSPGEAQTVPLAFVPSPPGQPPPPPPGANSGAWFTVTGGKLGDTTVSFAPRGLENSSEIVPAAGAGDEDLATLGSTPRGQLAVHVRCKFKVTISATRTWTIKDTSFTGSFTKADVLLEPDADGKIDLDTVVLNNITKSGPCGGGIHAGTSHAHFSGRLTTTGLLQVTVTFTRAGTYGSEGCVGKSHDGWVQAQPLTFAENISAGRRSYFYQRQHVVDNDQGSQGGTTLVYLTVLQ